MANQSINPANNRILITFDEYSLEKVTQIIQDAQIAFEQWRTKSFSERSNLMMVAAENLRSKKLKYAEIMTKEMGKPISQAIAEVEKCAWVCEYYAENAESFLSNEFIDSDAS